MKWKIRILNKDKNIFLSEFKKIIYCIKNYYNQIYFFNI